MASTAIVVDWAYLDCHERELFAEGDPRRYWVLGQNNLNLGC